VIDNSLFTWFYDLRDNVVPGAKENFEALCTKVTIVAPEQQSSGLAGSTFVITGKVDHFTNHDALKKFIEDNGGRVAGSVSANTNYLINNDSTSASSKKQIRQKSWCHNHNRGNISENDGIMIWAPDKKFP